MNDWYIDRSNNCFENGIRESLAVVDAAQDDPQKLKTESLIGEFNKTGVTGNVIDCPAAITGFRDHGILRMDNTMGDTARLYYEDELTYGELVIDLFVKRFTRKKTYTPTRPCVLICMALSYMIQMGLDEDDIFLTTHECHKYLRDINDYNNLSFELVEQIIGERKYTYESRGRAIIPCVELSSNGSANYRLFFNALKQSPLFISDTINTSILRPNIKQKEFFRYIAENAEEFKVVTISNNPDLYKYYCDRKYGFAEIIPALIKADVILEEKDISLLFDYLFGYDNHSGFDSLKYLEKEAFGAYFAFISVPGIAIAKIKDDNPVVARQLLAYARKNITVYQEKLNNMNFEIQNINKESFLNNQKNNLSFNEIALLSWMESQKKAKGEARFSQNTIKQYIYALKAVSKELNVPMIFNIQTIEELDDVDKMIKNHPEYDSFNKRRANDALSAGLLVYREFLNAPKKVFTANVNDGDDMVQMDLFGEIIIDTEGESEFHYTENYAQPEQIIYYGAPGTGKSFEVDKIIQEKYPDVISRDFHTARVVFHPDYTYSDFVGAIRPVKVEGSPLSYEFIAGPFTEILQKCFIHYQDQFYLVLEEINRGNAAAVFGDLFQLLDREEESGRSRYSISNSDIIDYLKKDERLTSIFANGKVWLPSNFNILCTMNTADQNVFVLDSAFKRRFSEEYTEIDFSKLTDKYKNATTIFEGANDLQTLFSNTSLSIFVNKLAEKGELKRDWSTFAKIVNYIIDDINQESGSEQISEDKKLGPFFVSVKDLESRKRFVNKVLHYLKQDVFKYIDFYFTESFQTIYSNYINESADLFNLLKRQGE